MAFAFLVRTPSATPMDNEGKIKEAYIDEEGLPYLTDMDSYYHARRVDEYIENEYIGNMLTDEGELWDTRSFYPEGRTAEYQPGIVYLTTALWRFANVFGSSRIRLVEFVLPALMSALCGLTAYITVNRVSNKTGGLVAGLLTGCAPLYTSRTCFGRFDTDMFVLLLDLLLILFVIEVLLTEEKHKQYIYAVAYVVTAFLYSKCWTPTNSMLFSGITLAGGLLSIAISALEHGEKIKVISIFKCFIKKRETLLLIAMGIMILLVVGITSGFSAVLGLFPSLSYKTTADVTEGSIPNLYV